MDTVSNDDRPEWSALQIEQLLDDTDVYLSVSTAGSYTKVLVRQLRDALTATSTTPVEVDEEMIGRATNGIRKRLESPSLHWGVEDLHPDAIPHIARAAVEAAIKDAGK